MVIELMCFFLMEAILFSFLNSRTDHDKRGEFDVNYNLVEAPF
jgi:hypothetical protein